MTPDKDKVAALMALGFWKGLCEAEWSKDDLIDMGKALFAKRSIKDLLTSGRKRDGEVAQMINRNFLKATNIMQNYVEAKVVELEARAKYEAEIAATAAAESGAAPAGGAKAVTSGEVVEKNDSPSEPVT